MKNTFKTAVAFCALTILAGHAVAAEVCTVSMMGRVCYEETDQKLTAGHMYAPADAKDSKKKVDVADASQSAEGKKK